MSAAKTGFPEVLKIDQSLASAPADSSNLSKRTLFSQQFQKMKHEIVKDLNNQNPESSISKVPGMYEIILE